MTRDDIITKIAMEFDLVPPEIDPQDEWGNSYGFEKITPQDIYRRRLELINEPDDADAPSWAEWKAQSNHGVWYWCATKPLMSEAGLISAGHIERCAVGAMPAGHDWRKTLKRVEREDKRMEWKGEELPPEGTLCEYWTDSKWDKCEILAYREDVVVFWCESDGVAYQGSSDTYHFRTTPSPEQRAEDEAVEEMREITGPYVARHILIALYRAGYRKH